MLGISEITVKCHRGQVMRKMNAASLVDLVKTTVALAGADQAKLRYAPLQCVRWGRSEIF